MCPPPIYSACQLFSMYVQFISLPCYCFWAGMVDVIFADVAQPDQTRIVALNAHNFLKNGGHFVISIKVNPHDIKSSC